MNAILTVIGQDKVGIIASVTACLANMNVNILDLSQTIMKGNFTMVMFVDLATSDLSFNEIHDKLAALGEETGLSIKIQRSEIFDAMYSI